VLHSQNFGPLVTSPVPFSPPAVGSMWLTLELDKDVHLDELADTPFRTPTCRPNTSELQ